MLLVSSAGWWSLRIVFEPRTPILPSLTIFFAFSQSVEPAQCVVPAVHAGAVVCDRHVRDLLRLHLLRPLLQVKYHMIFRRLCDYLCPCKIVRSAVLINIDALAAAILHSFVTYSHFYILYFQHLDTSRRTTSARASTLAPSSVTYCCSSPSPSRSCFTLTSSPPPGLLSSTPSLSR